jgi:hypothetical protein
MLGNKIRKPGGTQHVDPNVSVVSIQRFVWSKIRMDVGPSEARNRTHFGEVRRAKERRCGALNEDDSLLPDK